jgi:hypothetical protein
LFCNFLLSSVGILVSLFLKVTARRTFRTSSHLQRITGTFQTIRGPIAAQFVGGRSDLVGGIGVLLPVAVRERLKLLLQCPSVFRQPLLLFAELFGLLLGLRARSQLFDLILRLPLLGSQTLKILLSLGDALLQILRVAVPVVLIEQPLGVLHGIQRLLLRLLLLL